MSLANRKLTNLECLYCNSPIAILPEGLIHVSILPPSQSLSHLYLASVDLPVVLVRDAEYGRLVGVVGWVCEVGDESVGPDRVVLHKLNKRFKLELGSDKVV